MGGERSGGGAGVGHGRDRLRERDFLRRREPSVDVIKVVEQDSYRAHEHEFVEIVLVAEGEAEHETVYGVTWLRPGDAIVLLPGDWHAYRACRGFGYYNLILGQEFLHTELAWTREDPLLGRALWHRGGDWRQEGPLCLRVGDELGRCIETLEAMRTLYPRRYAVRARCELTARVLELLGLLAERLPRGKDRLEELRPVHGVVLRGVELFEKRLEEPWTLTGVAEALGVNASYLVRLFRAHTGLAPFQYLRRLRLERAAGLLLAQSLTVTEVMLRVGFSDSAHFARAFKAQFGDSPRAFRKRGGAG